ncbi:Phospholipase D/Transphosphatidylase [uncultured Desulfobacterium sp.]|uniref:Phospholipase D/Transphosphatidylase n=1 Tax=uncultured Desulfobacterium sp. TaxID=201089 RepID=A0A445N3W5_9BACT|nr:Phospholipase D/Transphosphatidylase [uncultured Desulfobacterium sp.]
MIKIHGIILHFLPSLGFILAVILLAHILRQRRSPTSTLAWLLTIIFIPYIGVPFYLMFGGRKMKRKVAEKILVKDPSIGRAFQAEQINPLAAPSALKGPPQAVDMNRVSVFSDGEKAYWATLDLIRSARQSVCVATFILGQDDTGKAIVAALTEKAKEGISVFLLLDALGSVSVRKRFLAPLIKAGGRTAFFMPMLHLPFRGRANLRNHRKMVIADGKSAIVGGMNLADEYMGLGTTPKRWQDLSMLINGPVCTQIYGIFLSDWLFASGKDSERPVALGLRTEDRPDVLFQVMASGPDVKEDALRDMIVTALFHAESRIWIVTPYFVPDELLLDALCLAAKRGIDLRVVIPKKSNHVLADLAREGYLSQLQECGASVFLYLPGMLHAKAIIMDDRVAITGSANMDMRSLLLNYELALFIYHREVIIQLKDWMQQLMDNCIERSQHKNQTISLIEGVGRLFAPLL